MRGGEGCRWVLFGIGRPRWSELVDVKHAAYTGFLFSLGLAQPQSLLIKPGFELLLCWWWWLMRAYHNQWVCDTRTRQRIITWNGRTMTHSLSNCAWAFFYSLSGFGGLKRLADWRLRWHDAYVWEGSVNVRIDEDWLVWMGIENVRGGYGKILCFLNEHQSLKKLWEEREVNGDSFALPVSERGGKLLWRRCWWCFWASGWMERRLRMRPVDANNLCEDDSVTGG